MPDRPESPDPTTDRPGPAAGDAAGDGSGGGRTGTGGRARKPGGRPRRRPDEGAPVRVEFQVSPVERDRLRELAGAAGLSVSEYVRRRALGGAVRARAEVAAWDRAATAVNRAGANLNQLVRLAHEAAPLGPAERAAAVAAAVERAEGVLGELAAASRSLTGSNPRSAAGGGP